MAEHRGVGPLQRHQTGPVAQHLKRSKGIGEEEEADAIIVRTPADLENLTGEEHRLDDRISEMQERLRELSGDENNKRLLYATEEDVRGLSCFQKSILIAIKAPNGTTLEVPDPDEAVDYPQRRYRMVLRSTMGPIDVYLVNGYVKFEEVNDVVEQQVLPSSCAPKAVSTVHQPQMSTKSDMEADVITEPQNLQSTYPQTNSTQDPGGIMRIVPSDIDRRLLAAHGSGCKHHGYVEDRF